VTGVARELDLVASALAKWVKHAQADRTKAAPGLTSAQWERGRLLAADSGSE
jgi:transposase-like protein